MDVVGLRLSVVGLQLSVVGLRLSVVDCAGVAVAPSPAVLHPEGGGVERTPLEDFVSQQAAGLPVLVTQQ